MTGKSASRLENIVNIWYIDSILLRVYNILWVYIFWIYCLYIVSIYCGWCTQHLCLFPVWSRPDWILTVGNPHRTPIITIVVFVLHLHLHHLTPIIVVIISFITFNTNTNTNIEAACLNDVITISIIVKIVLCIIWQISLSPGLWFILLMLNPELCHFLPPKKTWAQTWADWEGGGGTPFPPIGRIVKYDNFQREEIERWSIGDKLVRIRWVWADPPQSKLFQALLNF